jgi:hypothetical protein
LIIDETTPNVYIMDLNLIAGIILRDFHLYANLIEQLNYLEKWENGVAIRTYVV